MLTITFPSPAKMYKHRRHSQNRVHNMSLQAVYTNAHTFRKIFKQVLSECHFCKKCDY